MTFSFYVVNRIGKKLKSNVKSSQLFGFSFLARFFLNYFLIAGSFIQKKFEFIKIKCQKPLKVFFTRGNSRTSNNECFVSNEIFHFCFLRCQFYWLSPLAEAKLPSAFVVANYIGKKLKSYKAT
jgi:hypothetical protein